MDNSNTRTVEKQVLTVRNIILEEQKQFQEMVEVKLQIHRKYLAIAEEISKLEGDISLEKWLSDVLESGVEAEVGHPEALGLALSRSLKRRFEL